MSEDIKTEPCMDCGEMLHPLADLYERVSGKRRCFECVLKRKITTEARVKELEAERDEARAEVKRLREPVRWFAAQMERKLRAHDDRVGWDDCDLDWLLERLEQETVELEQAIKGGFKMKPNHVVDEAADVANFAMMIADNMRAHDAVEELQERRKERQLND